MMKDRDRAVQNVAEATLHRVSLDIAGLQKACDGR
jgi:hypothetical protein